MARLKTDVSQFPGVAEVKDLFDLDVLTDLQGDGEENDYTVVYAIGRVQELAAGIRGFSMTPYFDDLAGLEQFCQRHLDRFRSESESNAYPDATAWDTVRK